jgi:hypothetical protein
MPVFCCSFGMFFAQYSTFETRNNIYLSFVSAYKYLFFLIIVYFILYAVGAIDYFGMSTYTAYYVAIFSSVNNVYGAVVALILTLFTGKRAILIAGLLVLLVYLFFSKGRVKSNLNLKIIKISIIILLPVILLVAWQVGGLTRFENTINVDISNERSLYMATGGRSLEISSIIKHINNEGIWLTGGGFGEIFLLPELNDKNSIRNMHYSHMSPLYLVLVY